MFRWLLAVSLVCLPGQGVAQTVASAAPEVLRIDGSKNPELVPEYRAWSQGFRLLAGGPRGLGDSALPDGLREYLSREEEALLFKEADHLIRLEQQCVERAVRARAPLARLEAAGTPMKDRLATARLVDAQIWAIDLGCRWETLHARDRLLEALTPEASIALTMFIDSVKRSLMLVVPKAALERFRQPY